MDDDCQNAGAVARPRGLMLVLDFDHNFRFEGAAVNTVDFRRDCTVTGFELDLLIQICSVGQYKLAELC